MSLILLTGATGVIGREVVMQALARQLRLLALVRAPHPGAATERLEEALSGYPDRRLKMRLGAQIGLLPGDLASLAATAPQRLAEVTHILHLAADTTYTNRDRAYRTNRDEALGLARLAARLPRLERIVMASAATLCGRAGVGRAGAPPPTITEDQFPRPGQRDHLAFYKAAKAEAELQLREQAADLPLAIARPSLVVGHSRLGCRPSNSLLWTFRLTDRLRLAPSPYASGLDTVPVDWAAEVLLTLLLKPTLTHRIYHVSAGAAGRWHWPELAATLARREGRLPHIYDLCRWQEDRALLDARFTELYPAPTRFQSAMKVALRSYYKIGAAHAVFDNRRLLAEGVPVPPRLPDYMDVCLDQPGGQTIEAQFWDDNDRYAPD